MESANPLLLRFKLLNGKIHEIQLTNKTVTLGRSSKSDIPISDERVSRIHCRISFWQKRYYVRDLNSKNGTYVNHKKIDVIRLNTGDQIQVGNTKINVTSNSVKGTNTIFKEVTEQMEKGKGYHTILEEIVDDVDNRENK
jgi:pSer/pThr/pTyr-binding forkhead associated (FHA) protein